MRSDVAAFLGGLVGSLLRDSMDERDVTLVPYANPAEMAHLLALEHSDEGRSAVVDWFAGQGCRFTPDAVGVALRSFAFDDARLSALRVLAPRIVRRLRPFERRQLARTFSSSAAARRATHLL